MNPWPLPEFLLIVAAIVTIAWEPRPGPLRRVPARLRIRHSRFFAAAWVATAAASWLLFRGTTEVCSLVALLAEIGGVTYLAREVYFAQLFEEYRRGAEAIKPFVDLEPLIDQGRSEEYVTAYYKLDGRSAKEAEEDMSV